MRRHSEPDLEYLAAICGYVRHQGLPGIERDAFLVTAQQVRGDDFRLLLDLEELEQVPGQVDGRVLFRVGEVGDDEQEVGTLYALDHDASRLGACPRGLLKFLFLLGRVAVIYLAFDVFLCGD